LSQTVLFILPAILEERLLNNQTAFLGGIDLKVIEGENKWEKKERMNVCLSVSSLKRRSP
jgi:hypothetical protein